MIAFAHSLGVVAIGAGIETTAQREKLVSLGCDDGQGMEVAPVLDAAATGETLGRRQAAGIASSKRGSPSSGTGSHGAA